MTDPRAARLDSIRRNLAVLHLPELAPAVKDLDDAAPNLTAAVERLILGQRDGMAAASYDGGRGGGSSGSVPERLTEAGTRDAASETLAELDRTLRYLTENLRRPHIARQRICTNARTVWRIVEAWRPREAGDKQRKVSEQPTPDTDPLCQHCTPHRARGNAERVHRTGDVAGNLPGPMPLCHWCYRFVLRVGRLPTKSEVQRNDNGQRVMVKA